MYEDFKKALVGDFIYENLYCKVFLDTQLDYEEVFTKIKNHLGGEKVGFTDITAEWCEVSVRKNKEYSEEQYLNNKSDFINWKYYLDIEPVETTADVYIEKIKGLIRCLNGFCDGVVSACDFEDELKCM